MSLLKSMASSIPALLIATSATYATPKVVTSIKPIHSLVSAVMEGVGEPSLIVEGANSPHDFTMKPSQATALQNADIVFWIGHKFEQFLEKPLETIAKDAHAISLFDLKKIEKLDYREGALFEADDHGHGEKKEHADHDDHDKHEEHADHKDHDHDKHEEHSDHKDHDHEKHEEHAGHEGHGHGSKDAHIWLSPENAKVMIGAIEEELAEHDPDNAAAYSANAKAMIAKLAAAEKEIAAELSAVKGKNFIVFHDAYHYFEHHFDIEASGAISVNPELAPGVKRVREIQNRLRNEKITCVFSEPQFSDAVVKTVVDGTETKVGIIDPLGATLEDGPELYVNLIKRVSASLTGCLG